MISFLLFPMVQRYKFESKSQRSSWIADNQDCCFQWFKGTNLKANHNLQHLRIDFRGVVSNGSKVQIWKQITTTLTYANRFIRCFQWFKGTNLKANHNVLSFLYVFVFVVSNGSKVQIWKQITTVEPRARGCEPLFPMVQRYKFESKSQLSDRWEQSYCVVSNGSKVQIWKQITTANIMNMADIRLFPMVQRYKFESKSQLTLDRETYMTVVSNGSKVQIWKQITTAAAQTDKDGKLFPMVQRYKFESKSQLDYQIYLFPLVVSNGSKVQIWKQITTKTNDYVKGVSCFQWFKGTNLKANHNWPMYVIDIMALFPMVQRYKFESKSQHFVPYELLWNSCFQWFKGTNLKANHNL